MTDWPVKTLGDLLEVSIGGIWGSEAGEDEVDVFVYRSTELIKDGQLREELTVRRSITARQLDSRKLEEGDLLLEKSGGGPKTPVGRVGLVKVLSGLSVCSNFMQLMRPRKKDVLPVYLHYFLNHFHVAGHTEDLQNNSTNIRNLKTTEYMEVEIPLPPVEEQKRIVALLDAATARVTELTACYEQARTHANNLFTSASREAFESNPDWPVKTLGDVCELSTGGTPSTGNKAYYDGGEIKWLRSGDVHQREIYDCDGRITEEGMQNANTRYLPLNSVLIALAGQGKTRGTVAMLRTKATCNQSVVSIMPVDVKTLLPEFVFWNLHMKYDEIRRMTGDDGNDRRGLNMRLIRSMVIPVAPLEEQKKIVARLDVMKSKTSEMVAAYDAKLTAAKNLRQSILESAFEGKL